MPLTLRRTSAPAVTPVTWDGGTGIESAKAHLRLTDNAEQTLVEGLIEAATHLVEQQIERALITQTWTLTLDEFPLSSAPIELPRPPLLSMTSISYYDENGDSQTLDSSLYQADLLSQPGRLVPAVDEDWPDTESGRLNAVSIVYTAGYGATGASVPRPLRLAILQLVGHWFEHRESVAPVSMNEVPMAAKMLMDPFRVMTQR